MADGPIVFASDVDMDKKGPTEFGGRAGLIQGGVSAGEVHEVSASEARGILVRAEGARVPDPLTGLMKYDEGASAVDPKTGHIVDPVWNEDGSTGAAPVDVPPKTAPPTAGVF